MKKFCLVLVLAVIFNQALCRSLREKRQAPDEDDLDDRYGFSGPQQPINQRPFLPGSGTELFPFPNPFPGFPDFGQQRPAQGQFPGQNQGQFPGQFPGQGQNQGQFPGQNQGQFPGQNQGQFPGQNQGQFPGQNQGQFPGQNQGQFPGQGQNQGQFPGQGQNQGQFPGQGQNQGQFPGQGQNQGQFPGQGQNQGQFPGQGQNQGQDQNQGQNQGQQPAATTPSPSASIIQQCVRSCPVTAEYNPVCGSNNVTYSNPGRLICAQNCGETVTVQRQSPCPTPAPLVPSS